MSRSTRPRGTPLARRSFIKSMAATAAGSVKLMTSNQITPEQQAGSFLPESRGWGSGVSVVTKHADLAEVPGRAIAD